LEKKGDEIKTRAVERIGSERGSRREGLRRKDVFKNLKRGKNGIRTWAEKGYSIGNVDRGGDGIRNLHSRGDDIRDLY
jgi:hypothetical protein